MKNTNKVEFKRGQVWYETYNGSIGSEMAVGRPIVIVSSDEGNTSSSVVTALYMTTTPKNLGVTVEVYSTRKRSWVLCQQIVTIEKRRLTTYLCTLTETEMLRVELGLRKALGLSTGDDAFSEKIKELEKQASSLSDLLGEAKSKNSELEVELTIHKRLYEKALDKIVEQRFEKDTTVPERRDVKLSEVHPVIEKPIVEEVVPEIEVDVESLRMAMGAIHETPPVKRGRGAVKKHGLNIKSKPEEFIPYRTGNTANVNTDDWWVIVANTGMNIQTAQQIVAYRNKHGAYKDLSELFNLGRWGNGNARTYNDVLEV